MTQEDRIRLSALWRAGHTQAEIARQLGYHRSTISRELSRNDDPDTGQYHAGASGRATRERRRQANQRFRRIEHDPLLRWYIIKRLKRYWSPEQIAGRLRRNQGRTIICDDTIYDWIYSSRPDLKIYLRCQKGKWRRRRGTKQRAKRRMEANKKRIDTRPAAVETRLVLGHWEGDTVIGKEKTQRIATHTERASRYLLADKLDVVTAAEVRRITQDRFKRLPRRLKHSITYDNGVEFSEHAQLERHTKIPIYFAYPYHSWERGTNGLLRQFFPKGSLFADVTQHKLDQVVRLMNTRPRKCLNYATPSEVFHGRVAL